jgi:hypothetical protein
LVGIVRARRSGQPVSFANLGLHDPVRHQMRIIHRVAGKAPLKQIAAPAFAEIDPAAVPPVRLTERRAQAIFGGGHEDEVYVIVHQTPAKTDRAVRRAGLRDQRQIGRAILIAEENRQPPVPPLGDVMRDIRDNNARQTGHGAGLAEGEAEV